MFEKLKALLADDQMYLTGVIILLTAASFGLGRLSVNSKAPAEGVVERVRITTAVPSVALSSTTESSDKETIRDTASLGGIDTGSVVIGSKSGSRYHLPTCPGAKQIKPENRIEFKDAAAAIAAGYTKAANCPGL